jgi:YVTN family beta-propeller protein
VVFLGGSARAQTVTATLITGQYPNSIALNQTTNQIYVTSPGNNAYPSGSGSVTAINGATNNITTFLNLLNPSAVAVNPVTNRIYVANSAAPNSIVTVIDGATNTMTSVYTGEASIALAVNPVTNRIYVANSLDDTVTVIDGASNTILTTVTAGALPSAIAVNTVTNKIYVANTTSNTVTVINGLTNQAVNVNVGHGPVALAVNQVTNKIYVANADYTGPNSFAYDCTVTEIDGATNATTTILTGTLMSDQAPPTQLAVNAVTNKIYVSNSGSNNVSVIDGVTNAVTNVSTGGIQPNALSVDSVTNRIYVANQQTGNVTAIDGVTGKLTTLNVGGNPASMALNPVTNKIYVVNQNDGTVSVIAGAAATTPVSTNTTVSADLNPDQVGSRITFTAYVATTISAPVPAGSVTFSVDGISQPSLVLDSSGHAIYAVNTLAVGAHVIRVSYSGSPSFATSSGTLNETITLPPASAPSFAPSKPTPGVYYAPQSVTLVDATANSIIYYTLDGTTPTALSAKYTVPIQITKTTTLKAIATAPGYSPSAVETGLFTIDLPLASAPVFSLKAGAYASTQWVTLSDSTSGATLYYTSNGSAPTTASTRYSGPITVSLTATIQAIAVAAGHSQSLPTSVLYTITPPAFVPTFSLATGTYKGTQTVRIGDTTPGAVIYFTTNGTTPTTASTKYTAALSVSTTTTIKAIVTASGYVPSATASATYTITP